MTYGQPRPTLGGSLEDWILGALLVGLGMWRQEQRAQAPEDDDIEGDIEPEQYEGAFLMRAGTAAELAVYSRGPVTKEVVRYARATASAWAKLAAEG